MGKREDYATPCGAGWTGLTKRIWLLLYTEGGVWTAAEINAKLPPGDRTAWAVREMVESGLLSRREFVSVDGERSVKYGVTKESRVPRGVTVDEMWAVLQMFGQPAVNG